MRDTLRSDLTRALKARDAIAVAALRSALGAIDNAEAVDVAPPGTALPPASHAAVAGSVAGLGAAEVPRRELTESDVEWIVRSEVSERLAAADDFDRLRRADDAERLRAEAGVLAGYLPGP